MDSNRIVSSSMISRDIIREVYSITCETNFHGELYLEWSDKFWDIMLPGYRCNLGLSIFMDKLIKVNINFTFLNCDWDMDESYEQLSSRKAKTRFVYQNENIFNEKQLYGFLQLNSMGAGGGIECMAYPYDGGEIVLDKLGPIGVELSCGFAYLNEDANLDMKSLGRDKWITGKSQEG